MMFKTRHLMLFTAALFIAGCGGTQNTDGSTSDDAKDRFVGTYTRIPYVGTYGNVAPNLTGEEIQVSKSGDIYRLSDPYEDTAFTKKADGVLEDITLGAPIERRGSLGTITTGQIRFFDGSNPVDVLKVEFAFEDFLLIRKSEDRAH